MKFNEFKDRFILSEQLGIYLDYGLFNREIALKCSSEDLIKVLSDYKKRKGYNKKIVKELKEVISRKELEEI